MLSNQQILEFRSYLNKSENPLFFFDGDPDGLCSYLILKKYIKKGKGATLQRRHILTMDFYHKVEEYKPDYIFVLDIAKIDQDFVDKVNVPIIWLDHHEYENETKGIKYFNPLSNSKESVPTSYMAFKIAEEQELFLGTLGSIADWYYPEFATNFSSLYPNILPKKINSAPEAIFDSKLGEIIKLFTLVLKNSTSKVHKIANILLKIEDPNEFLDKNSSRIKYIYKETKQNLLEFEYLMDFVKKSKPSKDKLFYIELLKTKNSYTSLISNYLIYKYPKKVVVAARRGDDFIIMSIRSSSIDIKSIIEKSLIGLEGFGGGHKLACGAGVRKDQFEEFIKRFKDYLK